MEETKVELKNAYSLLWITLSRSEDYEIAFSSNFKVKQRMLLWL